MNRIESPKRAPPSRTGKQKAMTMKRFGNGASFAMLACVLLFASCSRSGPAPAGSEASSSKEAKAEGGEKAGPKAEAGGKEEKEAKLEKGHVKLSDAEIREAGIEAQELKPQELPSQITVNAVISANQDRFAHVSPRVPARITAVNVSVGDRVRAGQELASLDSLELGEAQAAWHQAVSDEALSRSEFERAESLHKDEIIAEKDYLRARTEYEKAKAQTRATTERLQMLGVTPSKASGHTGSVFALTAPFAGVVVDKQAVLGELAQPDKSVFAIADLSTVWIEASLFEKDLSRIRVGAPATISVPAYPGAEFKGKVSSIGSMLDKDTRTVPVRITVPNGDGRLKPQMFGTASIDSALASNVLVLPEAAVVLLNGETTVFIDQDGDYEARHVQIGSRLGGNVVIENGLKAGEWVVRKGAFAIKAKMLRSQIGDAD